MTPQEAVDASGPYPDDVQTVHVGDRTVILVGTAHISRKSVDLVRRVITRERPDQVCVELDGKRYDALAKRRRWELLDLKEILRRKRLTTLLVNLILASYQKRLGEKMGVPPGTELLEAAKAAEDHDIPVSLCDRDVRVTLRRAWHATSFFKKGYLFASLFASLFDQTEITEEKLAEMKSSDVLTELLQDLARTLPEVKRVLIDERDIFLAEKIKATQGKHLVAVVGAGHLKGIKRALLKDGSANLADINSIPPISPLLKFIGWLVPLLIIGSIFGIFWRHGAAAAGDNIIYWILANGIPSALGAMLALSHPLTIVSAFAAAPITSLTPVIGAGYVTAFAQLMVRPPVVLEFETVLEDMATLTGWWRNKLLKVLLAFLLPGLGSMIGTWVGGYEIISNLF